MKIAEKNAQKTNTCSMTEGEGTKKTTETDLKKANEAFFFVGVRISK